MRKSEAVAAQLFVSARLSKFDEKIQDDLPLAQLPSYSPDYNPIEKLWKQIKQEDTHLVYFPTFEALREKVETALLRFARRAADILSLCELPTELARAA